ncbi:MAG: GNAT family N-acetyltransferase [Ruminococcaceae bacterium]|nr:GNAT family N-acetyltransferase [Oscillospiraceae bacterium]
MKKTRFASISSKLPTLECERVTLRKMLFEDAQDMYEYSSNPDVPKYLLWYPHPDIEYTKAYLRYISQRYRTGDCIDWAVIDKKSGKMIGTCGFARIDYQNDCAEIGYVLNPKFQRQGIAAEAAKEVIKFGFETLGLARIEARYMVENTPSRVVMEKCDMIFEGVRRNGAKVKDRYCDVGVCAITREDYYALSNK